MTHKHIDAPYATDCYIMWDVISTMIEAIDALPGGRSILSIIHIDTFNNIRQIDCTHARFRSIVYSLAHIMFHLAKANSYGNSRNGNWLVILGEELKQAWSIPGVDTYKVPNTIILD